MAHDLSFRAKIFWCVLLPTLTALALPLLYARMVLHAELLRDAERQALREARLAARLMESLPPDASWPRRIRELGDDSLRLTLLSPEGHVLTDSTKDSGQLAEMDNHADRPELRAAADVGEGVSTRFSATMDNDMVYAAVKLRDGGFLRLAMPFAGLKNRISGLLAPLSGTAAGAALLALCFALLLSYRLKAELAQMVQVVEAISLGMHHRRLRRLPGKEFAVLADAVNRMAQHIEEHLRTAADQRNQIESILDTMNDGVLVLGTHGRIRRCNRALAQAFPAAEGAEGAQVVEVVPDPALQKAVDDLFRAPAEEAEYDAPRLRLEMPPGRFFTVRLGRARAETAPLGAVAVFHDVTDLVRLERIRRDFVANVSHELRTPLTAIQGYAETLTALENTPEDCRRFAKIILKHGAYLAGMVEELLTLSSLENEDAAMLSAPMAACDAMNAAAALCRARLDEKKLRLDIQAPEQPRVLGDARRLAQVFRNLLENACRYAPEGSSIRIEAAVNGDEVLFRVCDDGPGIPASALRRVFERFYRVEKHRDSGSTGLGLAICKHIIERHGGRIWAESPAQDCATAFCFTLRTVETHS